MEFFYCVSKHQITDLLYLRIENKRMDSTKKIIIIGAGLTGLTLAYYLSKTKHSFKIIEARKRIGGRIYTKVTNNSAPIELGATWFAKQHTEALKLVKELNLGLFEQILGTTAIYEPISTSPAQIVQLPKNQEPSYRLKGGTHQLINQLASHINNDDLILNKEVSAIINENDKVAVKTKTCTHICDIVISTLPPHLLVNSITFDPKLDNHTYQIAQNTHTWMGESIKIGFSYKTPFWRENNLSGTIFSNVGPIPEMYDHSNQQDNLYALKGFLNGVYYKVSKEERCELALRQLEKYYGKQARYYVNYEEMVWKNKEYTSTEYGDLVLPHQKNGDAVFQNSYYNHKLWIAGTETSTDYSGYMEGAIRSAQRVMNSIKKRPQN
ncbi:flavin monoamine oxidase family protein [Wenyingzhuangia aestuarii]|uniref:flavin monoamine oxidase family protein n=1 Tax=Wenyingzhuangia aestuarii TaxID=1647582 RepID=UPI001ADD4E68|nr:FAD-dependent oxidoreductase [Wenyingzhuangia aestuarii]NJB82360.1 monoamine oxidase [Wenyingzhuangia aestuarii]